MSTAKNALREMVEHWLAPDLGSRVRVTKLRKRRSKHGCYSCIETLRAAGLIALFFLISETARGAYSHRVGNGRQCAPPKT